MYVFYGHTRQFFVGLRMQVRSSRLLRFLSPGSGRLLWKRFEAEWGGLSGGARECLEANFRLCGRVPRAVVASALPFQGQRHVCKFLNKLSVTVRRAQQVMGQFASGVILMHSHVRSFCGAPPIALRLGRSFVARAGHSALPLGFHLLVSSFPSDSRKRSHFALPSSLPFALLNQKAHRPRIARQKVKRPTSRSDFPLRDERQSLFQLQSETSSMTCIVTL